MEKGIPSHSNKVQFCLILILQTFMDVTLSLVCVTRILKFKKHVRNDGGLELLRQATFSVCLYVLMPEENFVGQTGGFL